MPSGFIVGIYQGIFEIDPDSHASRRAGDHSYLESDLVLRR